MSSNPPIVNVHTPTSSFALPHSLTQDTLDSLFDKLSRKYDSSASDDRVGPGWLKYEWNDTIWNLDDDSDYTILVWRHKSLAPDVDQSPTLHIHDPNQPFPVTPVYLNPAFYLAKRAASPPPPSRSKSRNGSHSIKSGKSGKSQRKDDVKDAIPKHKKDFLAFHNENGVRTIIGGIGPVQNVRMLLKNGYRHVYVSRTFALKNGFIPADAAPGLYGYGGIVNIGQWPVTVGKTKTVHSVYLTEEPHFDCILGRSFMERRSIKTDATDPTNIVCLDTGEKLDCELVIIRDGKGEIVTVT